MQTRILLIFILLCAWTLPCARAQNVDAALVGQITDPSGGTIAEARVTMTQLETGAARTTETNRNGYFVVPALAAGNYEVEVQEVHYLADIPAPTLAA